MKKSIVSAFFLLLTSGFINSQSAVILDKAQINFPVQDKLSAVVFIPIETFSIDAKDHLEETNWDFDYYNVTKEQIRILCRSLFLEAKFEAIQSDSSNASSFTLSFGMEGTTTGKISTAYSDVTTNLELTWKLASNKDSKILFREKITGSFTNKIGNLFNGKKNARKRMEGALNDAFLKSFTLLYTKIGEIQKPN
ncbi:MAG: hypothetical protein WAS55_13520 [Saprospiraceae bacterium]